MSDFSEYVSDAARAAGFDIDSPRGGGKKALAEAAGMSQASVSRMLAGKSDVETAALPRIAQALSVPVEDLLRLVGLLAVDEEQGPVTAAVVAALREIRQAQKVSARELADRMTALGYPIQRSVIANCESGRRSEISVDHLAFAARALGRDAATVLRHATTECPACAGTPPTGFTCNTCGGAR